MDTVVDPESAAGDPLDDLAYRAYREFIDVSDFIWKCPNLIRYETKVELRKIATYFPDRPESKKIRWSIESHKLRHTFPYMIAVGNLFSILSLFESYLLLLATELQSHTAKAIRDERGQGITKLFNYLKSVGIAVARVSLYEQVHAAIMVRNCLMHSSGILSWSRENSELRRMQACGGYLSMEHRQMRKTKSGEWDEVFVATSALGDRLGITNEYAYVASTYLREYFAALCTEAKRILQ